MASNSPKDLPPADEKAGSAEKKNSKSETSSGEAQSEQRRDASPPGAGIPANPFDFSAMTGLLNDPSIKELAEQISRDPSFNQMAEQLQKTFQGPSVEEGLPQFDSQQYYNTMQQVMQNPQFMTMAERLGNALMQDPSMSNVLESFTNPSNKDQLEERMARIKEDPSLKPILEEIETGGPAAMMRYWNDKEVLQKLGEAMGLAVSGDAATSAEHSGFKTLSSCPTNQTQQPLLLVLRTDRQRAAMHLINAVIATRMLARNLESDSAGLGGIPFGTAWWFIYAGISCFLVLFAGIMSGLTLGLMSLGLVDLEILQRSGTISEKKQAAAILPVVQKQHQLLVTLLLCNAVSMEALPIYLDKLFNQYVAILLSVTFVLAFGEVIPQAICTRYGLAVGANFVWLVRVLMIICYPIAYPIGKILDWVLGHNEALFRRAQLKALVSIHSQEAGKGGELTHDETTIISGALDLTEKTAEEAMTPIESTFSLDVNSKLDWEAMGKILARGHSRVPVYSGNPKNVIGLLLVKSLLTVRPETETPVSAVSIRRIPRVPADMPLYDILNEFQKGSSHMAAVVKSKGKGKTLPPTIDGEKSEENKVCGEDPQLTTPLLKQDEKSDTVVVEIDRASMPTNVRRPPSFRRNDTATNGISHLSEDIEDGEVIGIITLEDVFEELLQEEIVDETDEYVDVHKRIRVAAAAAASSVARAPSIRRLTGHKGAGGQSKQGQTPKKSAEDDLNSTKSQGASGEPFGNKK